MLYRIFFYLLGISPCQWVVVSFLNLCTLSLCFSVTTLYSVPNFLTISPFSADMFSPSDFSILFIFLSYLSFSVDLLKAMIFISSSSIYQHPPLHLRFCSSDIIPEFHKLNIVAYYILSIGWPLDGHWMSSNSVYSKLKSTPLYLGILLVSISGIALRFKTCGSRLHPLDSQLHHLCTLGSSPIACCTLSSCSIHHSLWAHSSVHWGTLFLKPSSSTDSLFVYKIWRLWQPFFNFVHSLFVF